MKGIIIYPPLFAQYVIKDRYDAFTNAISKRYGFPIIYAENYSVPADMKVVMTMKGPQHSNPRHIVNLATVKSHQRLIGYFADVHGGGDKFTPVLNKVFERFEYILSNSHEYLARRFPKYVDKAIYFPNFPAPYPAYTTLPLNPKPIKRALVSGYLDFGCYPLRTHVAHMKHPLVDVIKHPGNHPGPAIHNDKSKFLGARYANKLREYGVCVTCGSHLKYMIAKYIEIMATGALLLAPNIPDVEKAGFVAGTHFIDINKENAGEKITECVNNLDKYTSVRQAGMVLARKNHSMAVRLQVVYNILDNIAKE